MVQDPHHNSAKQSSAERAFILRDNPDALREVGVDDEQEELTSLPDPARPLPGASPVQAVARFYYFYTLSRGRASRSEVLWALAYLLVATACVVGLTVFLGNLVEDPHIDSLVRVLYMLMVMLTPVWVIVNLLPFSSLMSRARGKD